MSVNTLEVTPRMARLELARRAIQRSYSSFLVRFPPEKPFLYGRHTHIMVDIFDEVIKKVEQGISQYVIVTIPFRHGKSGISSCRLPVWSLLRNPEWEHIIATYNFNLAAEMSIKARSCFLEASRMYKAEISQDRNQIGSWKLEQGGGLYATGIGGTITGRGAHIVIIDDYYKGIEEAESTLVRERVRHNFESNLMTRLKPVHAVIIVANRWHTDDLIGWIEQKNDPKSTTYDKNFPAFRKISFPAWSEKHGWLFPECYGKKWYETVKALIGTYAWNAQGQQEPQPRTGNMLMVNNVHVVNEMPKGLPWCRGWDLASSEKERTKDDPDYSVGTRACYVDGWLYVDDVVRGQWTAPKRDKLITEAAIVDGPPVPVYIEVVAGYKDAFMYVRDLVQPHGVVTRKFTLSGKGDKVARATCVEAAFEMGRVKIKRAPWNDLWTAELGAFPAGKHDDQVDSLITAVHGQVTKKVGFQIHVRN